MEEAEIIFIDFDQFPEVLDAEVGKGEDAVFAAAVDPDASVLDLHFIGDVRQLNDVKSRESVEAPALRIIDEGLWQQVKARQSEARLAIGRDANGNALNRVHRRKFLLSELLSCGVCNGGYTIIARDRYGCATRRAKGTCSNGATITRQAIEARVFAGIRQALFTPDFVRQFIAEFEAEVRAVSKAESETRRQLTRECDAIERKIAGILKAIEDGMYAPVLKQRMQILEQRRAEVDGALAGLGAAPVMMPHPALAEIYQRKVADLEGALNDPLIRDEAGEVLRSLIERVVLTPAPGAPNGLAATLQGDLAAVLALCEARPEKTKLPPTRIGGSQLSVVAGAGFEPATFRL